MKPVNLRELFGSCYRTTLDEAAQYEPGGKNDPWYFQISCKYGHFYPYSGELMGFCCESRRIRDRFHKEHPEIEVRQWADDGEAVFLFTPEQFELVASYAKPRKRRRLSESHKRVLAESSRRYRFVSQTHGSESR